MNFIITKKCDKNCPYCFAHQARVEDPTSFMNLDQFSRLVDKCESPHIKLLGGEPTQHPQFKEMLGILDSKHKSVTLISNFLFKQDILQSILFYIKRFSRFTFLVNSTDLDKFDRLKTFKYNYNKVYDLLYTLNQEENLACGITLITDNSLDYYITYLESLKKSLKKIERLRISINFPGDSSNKSLDQLIGNKHLGQLIVGITMWCLNNFIIPTIDCIYFPCLFKNKEEYKIITKFISHARTQCGHGAPADLFPDETISYCYPLKDKVALKFSNFNNEKEAQDALQTEYQVVKSLVTLPEDCKSCNFFNKGICEGPCLGFYNLENLEIPNWQN